VSAAGTDRIASDPQLPGLDVLFEPERLLGALSSARLPRATPRPTGVSLDYLRLKRGRSAIASGRLRFGEDEKDGRLFSVRILERSRLVPAAEAWLGRGDGAVLVPELSGLVFLYPADPALRALPRVFDPDSLKRAMTALHRSAGDPHIRFRALGLSIETVRYKAARRAVLRAGIRFKREPGPGGVKEKGALRFFLRVAGVDPSTRLRRRVALHAAAAAAGVLTPRPIGALPRLQAIVEEEAAIEARPVTPRDLGRVAARLHRGAPVPDRVVPDLDEEGLDRAALDAVDALLPELAERARRIAGRAAAAREEARAGGADRRALLHGDLAPDQAFPTRDESGSVVLLDLDRAAVGPPSADVASALARYEYLATIGTSAGDDDARESAAEFLAGYAEFAPLPPARAIDARVASSLLRLATAPARSFRPRFRAEAEAVLDRAEARV